MSGIVGKNLGRGSGIITATPVGADTVSGASIVDDAIDSEHYADVSIDAAHIASNAVTTAKINADAVTGAKIADDALGAEHYAAGSVDATALGADCVTAAKIGDNVLNSEHYAAGSIDLEHMSSESVDEDNLHISNSGSNGQFLSKQSGDACGLTWATVTTEVASSGKFGANGDRGVFAGGHNGSTGVNTIDYITIPAPGNAVDFGNLNWNDQGGMGGASNGSRGVFAGGYQVSVGYVNFIDYITIAIPGAANATDFGDLTAAMGSATACSNGSRGVFGGGFRSGVDWDTLDYITIATTGNASDFGDLTTERGDCSALANNVRGIFAGGETGNGGAVRVNTIDYITIATTGNASDFGD